MKKQILVLCTGNSCRSQIAEGYLRQFANGKADIFSAGIETHGVNPTAVKVMMEDGVDISNQTSNNVNEYSARAFDFVITVCDNAKENCPFFPAKTKNVHFNFPDPSMATGSEQNILQQFRTVRSLIKEFCQSFVMQNL